MRPALLQALTIMFLAMSAQSFQVAAEQPSSFDLVPLEAHSGAVADLTYSPDGKWLLSSGTGVVKLWDAATGRLLRNFPGDKGAFLQDTVLVLARDNRVEYRDIDSGKLINSVVAHKHEVTRLSVATSRPIMATLSIKDRELKIWSASTGAMQKLWTLPRGEVNVALSPDGKSLFTCSPTGFDLVSTDTLKILKHVPDLSGGTSSCEFVGFSADSRYFYVGQNLEMGTGPDIFIYVFPNDGSNAIGFETTGMAGAPQLTAGKLFYRDARGLGQIELSAARKQDEIPKLPASTIPLDTTPYNPNHYAKNVTSWTVSPDGSKVAAGMQDGSISISELLGRNIRLIEASTSGQVRSVALAPHGGKALVVTSQSRVAIWDLSAGRLVSLLRGSRDEAAVLENAVFSADGSQIYGVGARGLGVWSLDHGTYATRQPLGPFQNGSFSRDGERLAAVVTRRGTPPAADAGASTVVIVESRTGRVINTLSNVALGTGMKIADDGGHLAVTVHPWVAPDFEGDAADAPELTRKEKALDAKDRVDLWDVARARKTTSFNFNKLRYNTEGQTVDYFGPAPSFEFAPGGRFLVTSGNPSGITAWDLHRATKPRAIAAPTNITGVDISRDGGKVLAIRGDSSAIAWGFGPKPYVIDGFASDPTTGALSSDGARAAIGHLDGTITLWDVAAQKLKGKFTFHGSDEWSVFVRDGFFAASSPAVAEHLSLVRGREAYDARQIYQALYQPDLVREALAGDPNGEVAEAAKVANLEAIVGSGPVPAISIVSPAPGSQSATDFATVAAQIEDRGKGVGRIEWRVNGITAAVAPGPEGNGPVYILTRELALDPGDNTVEIVAYNRSNLMASLPARTIVKFTGPTDKTKPKLYILTVGVDTYVDEKFAPPLDLAENDAKNFAESMQTAAAALYDGVHVVPVLGSQVTRVNLERAISRIAGEIHPRDSFILFAAGHGVSSKGRFYLIPHDYNSAATSLRDGAIGQDALQEWLANRIRARKALILLDTCQSGALVAGHRRSRIDGPASEAGVGRLHEATGRSVLTAAAAGQDAIEGVVGADGKRHGVFTSAILDALRNGDANGDGLIELSELVAHVQNVVPKVAAELGDEQAARFGSRGENFVVARRLP